MPKPKKIQIPYGDAGVTIDASHDRPLELTAGGHDLSIAPTPAPNQVVTCEGLGAGKSRPITSPTNVKTTDGTATTVYVKPTSVQYLPPNPAREHQP